MTKRYWLFKSEPSTYSLDDLERDTSTFWDGIRNYQVRNLFRDDVQRGDAVLFYHSSCKVPAAVGLAKVVGLAEPDPTQFDPNAKYYDAGSKRDDPRWLGVTIEFVSRFARPVPLEDLKSDDRFDTMLLVQRGQRLSVQPVDKAHFDAIVKMGSKATKKS
ncbi:MAG: EVE domain-containing protein [Planctomycetes bacterium]|nr:EVE domain-containing protein [Planctomycetota bacterium]MCB9918489.1 EVE domain-containing protein [Planctomycetota bacterium]